MDRAKQATERPSDAQLAEWEQLCERTQAAQRLTVSGLGLQCQPLLTALPALLAEVRRLRAENAWIPVSERMPEQYASALIAHVDTRSGAPTVEEAQWDGDLWTLVRTEPCDDPIRLDEQVLAWREIPEPPTFEEGSHAE